MGNMLNYWVCKACWGRKEHRMCVPLQDHSAAWKCTHLLTYTVDACPHVGIDTTSVYEAAVHGWPSNCVYFDERFCVSTWLYWIKEMEKFSFGSCLYGALQFLHISPFQKLFFIFSSCNLHLFLSTLSRSIPPTIWCPFPTELYWLLTTRSWAHTHTSIYSKVSRNGQRQVISNYISQMLSLRDSVAWGLGGTG